MSVLNDISQALLDSVYAQLTVKPKRYGVLHGSVAYDECCSGMLWVRWTSLYLSRDFPAEDADPKRCGQIYVAEYEVGLLRCVPVQGKSGNRPVLPSSRELAASADQLATDATAMMKGLCVQANAWAPQRRSIIGRVLPDETAGQCGGSIGTITVEL